MSYNAKILNATNLNSKTFEDLAKALENPWLSDNMEIPEDYRAMSMLPEEFLEHEEIIISSKGTIRPPPEFEFGLPWNFREYVKKSKNTMSNQNMELENAALYISPGHLDGPQIYVLDEERNSPNRRLNFNEKRSYIFGRRPEAPSGILERLNPFLEKKGTLYIAENTPEGNYDAKTTKIMADTSIASLQGAIIRNDEDVSIVNLGISPIFVYLKKRETEPIMRSI